MYARVTTLEIDTGWTCTKQSRSSTSASCEQPGYGARLARVPAEALRYQ
jgi:hypothetical protein